MSKLAIFGQSCTGKTSLASAVASQLGTNARHCGEIVKGLVAASGMPLEQLSLEALINMDADTRKVALSDNSIAVIEGNFLDQVLWGVPNITFVKLIAPDQERAARLAARMQCAPPLDFIRPRDARDRELRRRLYGNENERAVDALVIDTSRCKLRDAIEIIVQLAKVDVMK